MAEEFDAPQSRNEALLQNILGAENEILPPMSNNERILLNILGETGVEIFPPQSRIEELLLALLEQGTGGGESKLPQVVSRMVTELTEADLVGVTSIGAYAFSNCIYLYSITIPSSVTSIETNAFANCLSLQAVTIPSSVTSIGSMAFTKCSALTSVTVEATTPPSLGANAFRNAHDDLVIYVPAASVDTYKAATNWSTYASKIQAIPTT